MNELVTLSKGKAVTSTQKIAEVFEKENRNVVRVIESLQVPHEWRELNFEQMVTEVEIGSGATRKVKGYNMTRDGFTILAMGFTGKKAMEFKLAYIDAFNRMEAELAKRHAIPKVELSNAHVYTQGRCMWLFRETDYCEYAELECIAEVLGFIEPLGKSAVRWIFSQIIGRLPKDSYFLSDDKVYKLDSGATNMLIHAIENSNIDQVVRRLKLN